MNIHRPCTGIRLTLVVFLFVTTALVPAASTPSELEDRMQKQGLVDVQQVEPSLRVELKYSTTDNFLKEDVYGDLERAYLLPTAARKLQKAQALLRRQHADYTLLVYDAARPSAVQRRMWALVKGTDQENYVADPDKGSVHNFGAAVDLTILGADGRPLDMGTPFDFFGDLAQPRFEQQFLGEGKLTAEQVKNRKLLRAVMEQSGFSGIPSEWWHFNAIPLDKLKQYSRIIE